MATRYWVGGSGAWDISTTTNWSATSGGAGGASAPTSADDVVFDTLSNATSYSVTMTPAAVFTASITGSVMTVTAVTSGTLAVGQNVNIFGQTPYTVSIASLGTGTGGTGTYNLNISRTTASGTITTNGPVCRNVTVAAPLTGAISFTTPNSATWSIYGNFALPATNCTTTVNISPAFVTSSAITFAPNAVNLGTLQLYGTGSLNCTTAVAADAIYMFSAGFVTNNNTITTNVISSQTTSTNIIVTLGSSTVTLNTVSLFGLNTGNVLNAGTSTINLTGTTPQINGGSTGGFTFYNVNFTSTAAYSATIYGVNTFNNLSITTATTSSSISYVYFASNQIINGTLTMSGASYTQRLFVQASNVTPAKQTITLTVNAVSSLSYIDFGGIVVAGASAPWSGTSIGDLQGNVNINVTPSKNVYWNYPNTVANMGGSDGRVVWATSSGGATAVANFPLAQDTCIFDNTGFGTGGGINYDRNWALGRLDFSRVTNSATFQMGSYPAFYLDVIFTPSLTLLQTAATTALFASRGTQTLVSAGLTFPASFNVGSSNTGTSTLTLAGAAAAATGVNLGAGLFNLNNNNLTCGFFNSSNSTTRSIAFGTSQIYVTGSSGFQINIDNMTGFTYTGSGVFNYTYSGSVGIRYCVFGNSAGATESNALTINYTAGTDQVSPYGLGYKNINFTGFAGTWIDYGARTIYGDLTISTGMSILATPNVGFNASSGTQNITSNGKTLTFPITKNGAGTLRLVDAMTLGSTLTFTHNVGTLDLNNNSLTCGLFASSNSNVRSITSGTGQFYVTGNNATVLNLNITTNLTYDTPPTFNLNYSGSTGARVILGAAYSATAPVFNVNITAGSDTLTWQNAGWNNVNYTGFTGTATTTSVQMKGDLTLGAGMTTLDITNGLVFVALTGTQQIRTNGVVVNWLLIFNSAGAATIKLLDALTTGAQTYIYLNAGILDLNSKTLTCGVFNAVNSSCQILFSGAGIYITGNNTTVFNNNGVLSYTGTPNLYFTYSGSTGTRIISGGASAYPLNYYFTAGSDILNLGTNTFYGTINFTGFSGTLATFSGNTSIRGDLVLSSAMTFTASSGVLVLSGTVTQNVTTNGKTINSAVSLQGTNYVLQDNLTVNTVFYLSIDSGAFNLNGKTVTIPSFYTGTASARSIAFGGGTMVINGGSGYVVFGASGSNFTTSGPGTISFTAATNKVFNGAGFSYPTISQDGAGILYINGNNTYQDMTATVFPSTIDFGAGSTHSFYNFSVVGTAGNLVTVNSFVPGSSVYFVNLSGHNLGGNYMYLQDINASPANTWYGGRNTTNVSNNTGWVFYNYFPVTATENATLADVETNIGRFRSSTLESFTTAETDTLGLAKYNVATLETISLLERITTSASFSKSVVEALTVLNTQTGNAKFLVSRSENSTMADAETNVKKLYSAVLENFAPANSQTNIAKYNRSVVESFSPASTQINTVQYNSAVIETVVTFDSSIGRGWFKIADSQNPNWTVINDTQL